MSESCSRVIGFASVQGFGSLPLDVGGRTLISDSVFSSAVDAVDQMVADSIVDLCELELEADLDQRVVLTNRVGNPRLNAVTEKFQIQNQILKSISLNSYPMLA